MSAFCRVPRPLAELMASMCKPIFLVAFLVSTALKASLAVNARPYAWAFVVVLAYNCIGAPVSTLADAVVSAATTDSSQYGRCRLWGAVWWGSLSLLSGAMIEHFGFNAAFALYFVLSLPGVPLSCAFARSIAGLQRSALVW